MTPQIESKQSKETKIKGRQWAPAAELRLTKEIGLEGCGNMEGLRDFYGQIGVGALVGVLVRQHSLRS